jgi:hypothetical protein
VTDERDIRAEMADASVPPTSRRAIIGRVVGGILLPPLTGCAGPGTIAPSSGRRLVSAGTETLTVTVGRTGYGLPIGPGYAGFSYEKSSLSSSFFAASNQPLVRLFRRLGPGLLRVGGNSVDRTSWRMSSAQASAGLVTATDVDALATFLRATGWTILYGINLATNSPAMAAEEAGYVARALGPHLYAFELGNEPDAYSFNHLRAPSFSYRDFIGEWNLFARAIRQGVPQARLTGPASAWHETSWTVPFAQDEGHSIVLLTQHYYRANGLSPQSTLALLLAGDPALPTLLDPLAKACRAAGIKDGYRLTEANSFYDGGAPHISNTFGTALWAIDFLFANARLGSSGVNFHGGGAAPGYTPLADDGRNIIAIRPEYYGMWLFSRMGSGRLLNTSQSVSHLAISTYGIIGRAGTQIMIVNKEADADIDVAIDLGRPVNSARLVTLSAPRLDSLAGVTLNGAAIATDGTWPAGPSTTPTVRAGSIRLRVNHASAVLVTAA